MAARFTMRGCHDFQQGNCDKFLSPQVSLLCPAACTHNLEIGEPATLQTFSHLGHDAKQVFAMQTGASPKIPTHGVSGEISEFDVGSVGGLLLSTLPTGDSHCRIVHPVAEFCLIQIEFIPQLPNWFRPVGPRSLWFLTAFRHACTLASAIFGEGLLLLYADACGLNRKNAAAKLCTIAFQVPGLSIIRHEG
jgi:hypothetical protein